MGGRVPRVSADRGQAVPVLVIVVGMVVALGIGTLQFGARRLEEARAASVADAAALAGVVHGREIAAATAQVNGAELVGWTVEKVDPIDGAVVVVTVVVSIGEATAAARASRAP